MKKILLLHGWDYRYYYKINNCLTWDKRSTFIKELSKNYEIFYPDLPGFGKQKEPNVKMWTLDDYAKYIDDYIKENNLKIDYLLGYSFGGAVALRYKTLFNSNIKEILIAPALIRNTNKSKNFFKTPKILNPIRKIIRDIYLIKIIKVPEMVYGTRFLRNTYQNIVRINMLDELQKYNPKDFKIIYGDLDTLVNPLKVLNYVNDDFKKRIEIIKGGDHDIGEKKTSSTLTIINKFIK